MSTPNEISQLNSDEIELLLDELSSINPEIKNEFKNVKMRTGLSDQDVCEYVVLKEPELWAKVYLDWEARDYQLSILNEGKNAKKLVLRLGRRLGKTECMCIMILWHAYVQPNKGPNNQYDILIIAPFEDQVDLIFKRLRQLIDSSPYFKDSIIRDIHQHIEVANGTVVHGMTAGSRSGTGAANTRGQRGDLVVLDEVDYMGESEITNILNIRNEAPERIKICSASTPSGKREDFYRWCVNSSKRYSPPKSDIDNFQFSGYNINERKGNGWVEIYAPSIVNKELLKINPDTQQTYLEDLRDELTDMRFKQEVLAEFGEEEMGIYQKRHIDKAIEEGRRCNHKYISQMSTEELEQFIERHVHTRVGPLMLGVDWDKYSAATNLVILGLDKFHTDENDKIKPVFKIWDRIEIPRGNFTYTKAIDTIIKLNDTYNFNYIVVDRGYGETQIELLHKYGLHNPASGLQDKVIGYQFSEKTKVHDPYTGKIDKKPIKPFMVNNSVMVFERNAIVLNPKDTSMVSQLEQYRIKSITSTGVPTYTSKNEHALDAMNLCLLIFEQKYGELFKGLIQNARIFSIPALERDDNIKDRGMGSPPTRIVSLIKQSSVSRITGHNSGDIAVTSNIRRAGGRMSRGTLGGQLPSRRMF